MTTTQQTELEKTIGWMRREGVQGDDREVERYARDWLEMRERFGVSLHLKLTGLLPPSPRCTIPTRLSMEREAERIERQRTRTRIMLGYRVWVQAYGEQRIYVSLRKTDEPDSDWEVVSAGSLQNLVEDPDVEIGEFTLYPPVRREWRDDVRTVIGGMGAMVTVWPPVPDLLAWVEAQVPDLIRQWEDERDPWLTIPEIMRSYRSQFNLSADYDSFLRRLCREGRIKAKQENNVWHIRRSAIENYLLNPPKRGWPEGRPRHAQEGAD